MWRRIAKRRYTRSLAALTKGDVEAVLAQFAPDVRFVFVGDSPLGSELHSREEAREWFGRLFTLLPNPRFDLQQIVVDGWPWDVRIAARVLIHSTVAGEPYTNQFAQFLRLRKGRVVWTTSWRTRSSSSERALGLLQPVSRKRVPSPWGGPIASRRVRVDDCVAGGPRSSRCADGARPRTSAMNGGIDVAGHREPWGGWAWLGHQLAHVAEIPLRLQDRAA